MIATIGDFIAFKFCPQGGSRVSWAFNQVKYNLMKLQNVTHKLADALCNKSEQCKKAVDEFLVIAGDIPHDLVEKIAEFVRPQDDGWIKKKHSAAKRSAADYTIDEGALQGNSLKAGAVIKSLRFSSYEENNLCDLKEGIPPGEYDATVDEIADLTNMPKKLKKVIKRAKNFIEGNVLAVDRLQFKTEEGNMVFGRVVVIRRGKVLDLAYSLHSVEYELTPYQHKPEYAKMLKQFTYSLGDSVYKCGGSEDISFDLRNDFLAFFHTQAIEGFLKHCNFVLKTLDDEDGNEVLKEMGVTTKLT